MKRCVNGKIPHFSDLSWMMTLKPSERKPERVLHVRKAYSLLIRQLRTPKAECEKYCEPEWMHDRYRKYIARYILKDTDKNV